MGRRTALAVVVALTVLGFALRVYNLSGVPFRGDEAFAAQNWAGQPLADSLRSIATIEPHPPLTYALFRGWGLATGITEFTLRLLPALTNLVGIPAIYALGRRLSGRHLGVLAALIWAVNPYQVWHAQDARNYAIWAGLSLVAVWLGVRVVDGQRQRVDWVLYCGVAAAAAFVFYMELFTLAALAVYALAVCWRDRVFLARWLGLQGLITLAVLVTFVVFQSQLFTSGVYGGTVAGFDAPLWLTWFLPALLFGETLPGALVGLMWPVVLVGVVVGVVVMWRRKQRVGLLLGVLGGVPLVLLGVVSLKLHVFHPRYVISAAPAYVLAVAGLTAWIGDRLKGFRGRWLVLSGVVGVWLVVAVFSLYNHYWVHDYTKSRGWPALTAYLGRHVSADDLVIQTSVDPAFGYYYHAAAVDIGLPANPGQMPEDITATLMDARTNYRSIWVVGRTFADWPNAGIVERWAEENMQQVRSTQIDGLPIRQYMTWTVSADEIKPTPLTTFTDTAKLVGVHLFTPPEPTGMITLWLYWEPMRTTSAPLKVFVHLVGAVNPVTGTPLWSQDDRFPQNGRANTDAWLPGTIYRDVYTLPIDAVPPGDYELVVGFYDPTNNQRITITDGSSDSYTTGKISLP